MCDDGTLGDLSSGATTRASADTSDLFTLLWTNFANAQAPVLPSRGVSAAADFAAHKTIALPKMLGRVYGIAGAGSGLTSRTVGVTTGTETYQLTTNEIPSHNHAINISDPGHTHLSVAGSPSGVSNGYQAAISVSGNFSNQAAVTGITATSDTAGSGGAHSSMQPTVFLKMMVKL